MFKRILILGLLILSHVALSEPNFDIRISGKLTTNNLHSYVLTIDDCTSISFVETEIEGKALLLQSSVNQSSFVGCEFTIPVSSGTPFTPHAKITLKNGTQLNYTETFEIESNAPVFEYKGLSINDNDNAQSISVQFDSSDDIDIQYVAVDIVGFKASSLKNVGGIIDEVKPLAFANSQGYKRIFPKMDNQTGFILDIPLITSLTKNQIASDGLVLIDAYVVDSSGNKTAFSSIETTGGEIEEKAISWTSQPSNIVITDVLQSISITPIINFEFRGEVEMIGSGRGVTYTSLDPEQIFISDSGVIYVDSEIENIDSKVILSYPGLPDLQINVQVDLSKELKSLQFKGFSDEKLIIPSLNQSIVLPEIEAIFDDGSSQVLADQFPLTLSLPSSAKGVLELSGNSLKALKPVSINAPIPLSVKLTGDASVAGYLNIVALDAKPIISLDIKNKIVSGEVLTIKAKATDDVKIHKVNISIDGTIIASPLSAPFKVELPITDDLIGQTLKVEATAIDSAGQLSPIVTQSVQVLDKNEINLPEFNFELPTDNQRVIEKSPLLFQITHELGLAKYAYDKQSGIKKIEFYLDGELIGKSKSPGYIIRKKETVSGPKDYIYENWTYEGITPTSVLTEKSLPVFAKIFMGENGEDTDTKLLRLLKNSPAHVSISKPHAQKNVIAGQETKIELAVSDDTLFFGTDVEILLNNEVIKEIRFADKQKQLTTSYEKNSEIIFDNIHISNEKLGESILFEVKVTDFHGEIYNSEQIKLNVKNDQPPTVGITTPFEGDSWVAGLPIEIMAEASDDMKVDRVDFFVNEKIIGSDITPPYSIVYQTPIITQGEQVLVVRAEATDSSQQKALSQNVNVTLGYDQQSPVIHFVSPQINGTAGNNSTANVVENTSHMVKVTGYDNVGAKGFKLTGLKKEGAIYKLTGKPQDIITENDIPLQLLPGGAHAFSIVAYTTMPNFIGHGGSDFDVYSLNIEVLDERGNIGKSDLQISVIQDSIPEVTDIQVTRSQYRIHDNLDVTIFAKDDVEINTIQLKILNSQNELLAELFLDSNNGLKTHAKTHGTFTFDLKTLDLENQSQQLKLVAIAKDSSEQESVQKSKSINVVIDDKGPISSINKPVPGSVIQKGVEHEVQWSVKDASQIKNAQLMANGIMIDSFSGSENAFSKLVKYTVNQIGKVVFEIKASDSLDNSSTKTWEYTVEETTPPTVKITQPISGEQIYEGENFAINSVINDDGLVSQVTYELLVNDVIVRTEIVSFDSTKNVENYFSTSMRLPNISPNSVVKLRATALDNHNLTASSDIEISVLDDINSPSLIMSIPGNDIDLLPGEYLNIEAIAIDDIYIKDIQAILIDEELNEVVLAWDQLSRTDSIKSIKIPDPITIGSTIIKEKFQTDIVGKIKLQSHLYNNIDMPYQLKLRAQDEGINVTESASITLTLKPDNVPPEVTVISPVDQFVENQIVPLKINIKDNVQLSGYKVYFQDNKDSPIVAETGLQVSEVLLSPEDGSSELNINLNDFSPIPEEGKVISIIIEAWDKENNKSSIVHQFNIVQDKKPLITVSALHPKKPVQGGVVFYQTQVSDDFANENEPVIAASLTTSFDFSDNKRKSRFWRDAALSIENKKDDFLVFGIDYPESNSKWVLNIDDEYLVKFIPGELQVYNREFDLNKVLKLNSVNNDVVNFKLKYITDSVCPSLWQELTIDANQGVKLADILPYGVTEVVLIPVLESDLPHPFIRQIRVDLQKQSELEVFPGESQANKVLTKEARISIELKDLSVIENNSWINIGHLIKSNGDRYNKVTQTTGDVSLLSDYKNIEKLNVLVAAADRNTALNTPQEIQTIPSIEIDIDMESPQLASNNPSINSSITAGQVLDIDSIIRDNSNQLRNVEYFLNDQKVAEQGSRLFNPQYNLLLPIATDLIPGSQASLRIAAMDMYGEQAEEILYFPVTKNQNPELYINKFESHRLITDTIRLNYGEFWVKQGGEFKVSYDVIDDTGIKKIELIRLLSNGSEEVVYKKDYPLTCSEKPITTDVVTLSTIFSYAELQQYEVRITDNVGNLNSNRFYVHPLENIVPGIRITSPAEQSYITAGSFNLKVRVLVTDDMPISDGKVVMYANGLKLQMLADSLIDTELNSTDIQFLNEIYDDFQRNYGTDVANDYAKINSANVRVYESIMQLPIQLVKSNQEVVLTANVKDSENSIGSDEVIFIGASDDIQPEAAIISPVGNHFVTEASDFELQFRAFDNVKVASLELSIAYGVNSENNYIKNDYETPIRIIDSIPARDFETITSQIDTPIYLNNIFVPKINDLYTKFQGLAFNEENIFDVWVKLLARDHSGNTYEVERAYKVRVDERPVVDIVSPLSGDKVVENSLVSVNVHAYDDVSIAYV
ncbi:Ig-like domain-containing protein, partial [Pseudoalteromonas sp. '520P1 No. 412']